MSVKELIVLKQERKWFDFVELARKEMELRKSEEDLNEIIQLFTSLISKVHPTSIASFVLDAYKVLDADKSLELIDLAISTIVSANETAYIQEIHSLRMTKCIIYSCQRKFDNIESQIFSWKTAKLTKSNHNLLYYLAGAFYQSVGNIEKAQEYFLRLAKATNKIDNVENLMRLSILSSTFFDFSSICNFEDFKNHQNNDLKKVFLAFQNRKINEIDGSLLKCVIGDDNMVHITEKLYIMKIISICFAANQKQVDFDVFTSVLNIEEIELVSLLLKALGLNVLSGWIDSNERVFYFDKVIPRSLNGEELAKMKGKFMDWRNRISGVIELIEKDN